MTSIHFYQATKEDKKDIYDLLVEYKNTDLADAKYPNIDEYKLNFFISSIIVKGKILLLKDLEENELIGTCMFTKGEYFFATSKIIQIHMIYIKQKYRNFKLVKKLIDTVKKEAKEIPIVLSITSGLGIDKVFHKLGFENMGGNWRLL
tara:strand:+ start:25422 stop:25865 length:444 start_codon:yes stop_codon:yes gene_type:complete